MINLLSHDRQKQNRAARLNLKLRNYVFILLLTLVTIAGIFGSGYFLTIREREAASAELAQHQQEAASHKSVRDQATAFASNLKIAKAILSQEILYSDQVTEIARTLPASAVLTSLTLTDTPPAKGGQQTLNARVKTKQDAIVLKNTLEASPLFENVNINNISEASSGSEASKNRIVREFPVVVTIAVTQSKQIGVTP